MPWLIVYKSAPAVWPVGCGDPLVSIQGLETSVMQARLFGFGFKVAKGISLSDFLAHLSTIKGTQIRFGSHDRLLYLGERNAYALGLFLTIKDQRKTCEILKTLHGQYTIAVRDLEQGSNLVDFNFFLINKNTGRGLYQHYHNSCSLNQFGTFCRRQYDDLKDAKVEEALAECARDTLQNRKRVKFEFAGTLRWEMLVREEGLDDLMAQLFTFKVFEFDVSTITIPDEGYAPLNGCIKKDTRRLRFEPKVDAGSIRSGISWLIRKYKITKGKVIGKDEDGIEQIFRLMENPRSFGNYEYEEIADETVLNLDNIEESSFFNEMLQVVEKNRPIFEADLD